MNTVCVIGRIGRNPELKYTAAGKPVCSFSVAIDEGRDQEPTWIDVTAFDKTSEVVAQFLNQGDECAVSGRLRQERWEQGGEKRSKLSVVASRVDFLRKKGEGAGKGSAVPASREEAVAGGVGGGAVNHETDPFGDQ